MNNKQKTASDAIDFLSDAQEITERRLPWYGRVGILWIFIIMAAALTWACIGQVDVIVRARGRVASDTGDIIMKPLESAVIKSVEVHKGDVVEKGDVLLTLDPTLYLAEVERLQHEVETLEAECARWEAEFQGKAFEPKEGDGPMAWQKAIYDQRKAYYNERLHYFDSNSSRLAAGRKSTEESYGKYKEILGNMSKIEDMYASLGKEEIVSVKEALEVTISRLQSEAEVDKLRNQLVEYDQQLLSLEAERKSFVEEWRNNVSEKLVALYRELDGNRKQLVKACQMVSYVSLKAPCRAVVHEIAALPTGSAIGEAEAFMTLVPLDGALRIEGEVRPQDIARIAIGNSCRIKLTAFPFQKHGTLKGKLLQISGNTFQRPKASPDEHGDSSYYRVFIDYEGELRNTGGRFTLLPGMEAEVEIKTGRRRIIEYLIYPLIKGLDEAFREP
ncbi:MAG: HlyD family type I secretion periplasmic adaptor subunit [Victivallales bacterium]|nr:HlyD family type I secretion periplasmic adaptor subunit [Victivallales bacterium]